MANGKIIFETWKYEGRRYEVYGVRSDYFGDRRYFDSSYEKKTSAIARAEYLISAEQYDKVEVIDTETEE